MIDIHAHLLPAIDDGAENLEESIKMAASAFDAGTEIMVVTPHTLNGIYKNNRKIILDNLKKTKESLVRNNIKLKLIPGTDAALTPELIPYLESGDLMTINDSGKYILAELPPYYETDKIYKIIFDLQVHGITPIITHPERDSLILKNVDILRGLLDRGCLSQITAMSITGGFGKVIKDFSTYLIENQLVHVVASDCHSVDKRGPSMKSAFTMLSNLAGDEYARNMALNYPMSIIDGETIDIPPYKNETRKRSGWFWRKFIDRSY